MTLGDYLLSAAVCIAKLPGPAENIEIVDELPKGMKMKKFLPAVAILAVGIAAIATANARGGWDGNGLSISGFAPCALSEKQGKDCPAGTEAPNR